MKKKKTILKIVITILAIIVIALAGCLIYDKSNNKQPI